MKKGIFTLLVALLTINGNAQNVNVAETVFSSDEVRSGNMAITKSGRMFVTLNPLLAPDTKVYEIMKDGSHKPYPNNEYARGTNSIIKAIIGIRTDKKDNL